MFTPKGVTFGTPCLWWLILFIRWYVWWWMWVGSLAFVAKSTKAWLYPFRFVSPFASRALSSLYEKWTSIYLYLRLFIAQCWMKVLNCLFRFATLFALSFLGLLELVTGKISSGIVPFEINRMSGCVNFPSASSSSVKSHDWFPDGVFLTVLGMEVCRFWYTVFLFVRLVLTV